MIRRSRRTQVAVVAATALSLVLGTACVRTPRVPSSQASTVRPPHDAVVVASFNFDESRLLGEIYAQALERAGVPVRRELALGPRELVQPALREGFVDVVPEYIGSALISFDSAAPVPQDTAAVVSELSDRVAALGLEVMDPAAAENQNGFAVTRETAARLGIRTLSDLARADTPLSLAGPPECPTRHYCAAGLRDVYSIQFSRFDPYASENERITALEEGVDDVAVVFTTDAPLATNDFVLLTDDRQLQPHDNVVPIVSRHAVTRYAAVPAALDRVSKQLTTANLTFLNWRVTVAGKSVADEARGWLDRHQS